MSWARRLKRVFGAEIECCARCAGQLKIIASIEEPQLIAKILLHLERAAPGAIDPLRSLEQRGDGSAGAPAYVAQRAALQGREDPAGSGQYPEPKWLGMIQHDMELFDHGMPHADGSMAAQQRPEADVNIEFQSAAKFEDDAQKLAWSLYVANEAYATDYPATVGPHMINTDSMPFMELVPAISVRENERGREIGAGWGPHWHQPTDVYATFIDQDFRLRLNAAQTTLGAVARLAGASMAK